MQLNRRTGTAGSVNTSNSGNGDKAGWITTTIGVAFGTAALVALLVA